LAVARHTQLVGDTGYQGMTALHANSRTPQKKPRGQPLSPSAKRANRALARVRVVVEHGIGRLKVFHILLDRYRNRRRRFGLRFNLIAGIYNYELAA
jgi:IS5 family transposase